MARATLIAALVLLAAAARAQGAPAVTLDGCGGVVDEGELREVLRVELGAGADEAARLTLRCSAGEVAVVAAGRTDRISLADVPARMRARALALALAERVRRAHEEPVAPAREAPPPAPTSPPTAPARPPTAPTSPSTTASPSAPARPPTPTSPSATASPPTTGSPPAVTVAAPEPAPPRPPLNRRRLYGGLAVGLFTFSLAGIAIGAPLSAINAPSPEFRDVHIAGGVLMGVSAAAFATSAVTFGLWLRERRR